MIDAYILTPPGTTLKAGLGDQSQGVPEMYDSISKTKERQRDLGAGNWKIHKVKIEEIILSPMQAAKEALGTTPQF